MKQQNVSFEHCLQLPLSCKPLLQSAETLSSNMSSNNLFVCLTSVSTDLNLLLASDTLRSISALSNALAADDTLTDDIVGFYRRFETVNNICIQFLQTLPFT